MLVHREIQIPSELQTCAPRPGRPTIDPDHVQASLLAHLAAVDAAGEDCRSTLSAVIDIVEEFNDEDSKKDSE